MALLALLCVASLGAVGAPIKAPAFMGATARAGSAVPQADPRLGMHFPDANGAPAHTFGVERLWDTGANWCRMNPAPGVWDFTPLLSQLDGAASRGAHTAIVVLGFPPQHAVTGTPNPGEAIWLCPQPGYASLLPSNPVWDDYVTRIADQVTAWRTTHPEVAVHFQVWNEPAAAWFLSPDQRPARLVALAVRARTILGQHAPGSLLVSPSIVANTSLRRAVWQREFVAAAAARGWVFDVWAVHLYPKGGTLAELWSGPEGYLARLTDVADTVAPGRQPGDQLWITEINANVAILAAPVQVLTDQDQAAFVQLVAHDTAARGIPIVVWYRWHYDPWQLGSGQIVFSPDSPALAAWGS